MATAEELNKSGMELYKAGKHADAIVAYEEAVALKPDYAPCYINLIFAYLKRNRPDSAVHAAQRALALAPQAGQAHYAYGNALNAKGRWNEAVTAYVRASELENSQVGALVLAGNLCMDHGLTPKAIELWKKFLSAAPAEHPKRKETEEQLQQAEHGPKLISKY